MAGFDWDEHNLAHIARHQVTRSEVEELFSRVHIIKPTRKADYFYAYGRTADRYLTVVFTMRGERLRPATAYPMNRKDRKQYGSQLKEVQN